MKKTIITGIDPAKIAALPTVDLLLLREMQGKGERYLVRDAAAAVLNELKQRQSALMDALGGAAVDIEAEVGPGLYPFRTDEQDPLLFNGAASKEGA